MPLTGRDSATIDERRLRSRVLRLAAVVVCVIIVGRLGWLQLIRGEFYRNLSEDNYVQGFEVRAPRGLILDRHGEILADNRASLSVTLSRLKRRDDLSVAVLLSQLLELDESIDADENLLVDGMVDSLGMLRLIAFIEATYSVKVPPQDFTIENFRTASVLTDYLRGLMDG